MVGWENTEGQRILNQFDLFPAVPSFSPNPVAELSIANAGGAITVKLRVSSQPGQYILV